MVLGSSPSSTAAASPTDTVGAPSLSVMVPVASSFPVASAALVGLDSSRRKVSSGSSRLSWVVCTVTTTLEAPAAMVAVRAGLTAV